MSISRAKRWRIHYPVQLVSQDFVDEAKTVDVSLRGLSVETTRSVRQGTQVYVRLLLPGRTTSVDYEICTVQWAADGRMGLETSEMSTTEEQRLHRHLSALPTVPETQPSDTRSCAMLDHPIRQWSDAMGVLWEVFLKPLVPSMVAAQGSHFSLRKPENNPQMSRPRRPTA
jgi:PilZ domain-containing protein